MNRWICVMLAVAATAAAGASAAEPSPSATRPYQLGQGRPLGAGPAQENSGIVKSRQWPDLYWMHNDSGDEPRIYPVHRDGSVFANERYPQEAGVLIGGAINVDWEDIAMTAGGRLVVADAGNNANDRRDLALYILAEPSPNAGRTTFFKRVFFHYPEQRALPAPAEDFNYDCEALFALGETIYLCTKHRSDTRTRLYRVREQGASEQSQPLEYVDEFDVRGQVTGADASPDGKRVVLLTYTALWLFEIHEDASPFRGPVKHLAYEGAEDVEAVCFADEETLLLGAEAEGRLYEVPIARFESLGH